jgi:ligand-binding sensor domain-containing protein/two-component sensor histidine kinase
LKYLFLLVSVLAALLSSAQKTAFISYGTIEGLPQSQVTSIVQDKQGYLWVGTLGGLARFNGKQFKSFSSDDGLLNNRVNTLTIIKDEIWVGHEGGVSCISPQKIKTWSFNNGQNAINTTAITAFNEAIYIATDGGGIYRIENGKLLKKTFENVNDNYIHTMSIYQNKLLISTLDGVLDCEGSFKFNKIEALKGIRISDFKIEKDLMYISSYTKGFLTFNLKTEIIHQYSEIAPENYIKKIFKDSSQKWWISTSNGIWQFKDDVFHQLSEEDGLPISSVNQVFEDRNGNIWIATDGKGLLRYPGDAIQYFDKSWGLASDLVVGITEDRNENLWFSTYGKGIIKFSPEGTSKTIQLPQNIVWSGVTNVNGFHWFGTEDGLAQIKDDKLIHFYTGEENGPGGKITTILKVSNNKMYIGGSWGIYLYENGRFKYLKDKKQSLQGTVRGIVMVNQELFCATDNGFFKYSNQEYTKIKGINGSAYCIAKDKLNAIWIGTAEGLYQYKEEQLTKMKLDEATASNYIIFLSEKNNKLYAGSNNGLFILNLENQKNIRIDHYGLDEGIIDLESNVNSSFFDSKGYFWYGTAHGVVKINQTLIKKSNPKINIKNILLNLQPFDYLSYSKSIDEKGLPLHLKLPYSKNNLIFEIDRISLTNHDDITYQYWLEGIDEDWLPETKNSNITLSNLPSNNYVLHIRIKDINGEITDTLDFSFEIYPPFYKTWWFTLLTLLIIIYIIYSITRFKIKREREKSESEMLSFKSKLIALEQQSLNASMNRHFIFNSLNSIQYFINSQDKISANKYLTNFAKLIRKNLDSTAEEGNRITLEQELEGIELYLSLEAMRFKDRFEYTIDTGDVDVEDVVIPAMLLQPFIENSIIHGILPNEDKKGIISIKIKKVAEIIYIQIDDNGIGIEDSIKQKSNSKGDHKSQGMEITSKRIELIKKISNKGFEIIGPFQINKKDTLLKGTRVIVKIPIENLVD